MHAHSKFPLAPARPSGPAQSDRLQVLCAGDARSRLRKGIRVLRRATGATVDVPVMLLQQDPSWTRSELAIDRQTSGAYL